MSNLDCMCVDNLSLGPRKGTSYPLKVNYCGNCALPIEFCEFHPEYESCKKWLSINLPEEFALLELTKSMLKQNLSKDKDKDRKIQSGLGSMLYKKSDFAQKKISVWCVSRGKRRSVTIVNGMSKFDIDLKLAAKFFGSRFACRCSVTDDHEITIHGDFKNELMQLIPDKWPVIQRENIAD